MQGGGAVVRLFQGAFFYYFYFLGILLNDLELAVLEFKNIYKTQRTSLQSKIENGKHCREIGETPQETVETLGETCRNTWETVGNSKETGETQHSENNRENHHNNHGNLSPRNKAAKCISAKLNSHENKILSIHKIKLYRKKDCKKNVFF